MEIRVKRVMLDDDELIHYGVKGMKWGVRRYQNKDSSKNTNDDQLDGWGNLANRSRSKLAKLSGQSSDKISDDDRADFDWDVEGTEEARWVDNKKLSSKNPDDVKFVAKELVDFWDRAVSKEKTDYDPDFDDKSSTRASDYKKKYLRDPEAYAKAVIEEMEHIQKLRELDHSDDSTDELYHWGIKGMKWGVRRYQNKDGSLTAAGQKRRSLGQYVHDKKVAKKRKEAAAKARETKAKNAAEKEKREKLLEKGKIPVKKMTDEELKKSMERLKAEQAYQEKIRETSTWARFKHKAVNDMLIPALTESGKELAKNYLLKQGKDLLGLNEKKTKSAYDMLKEEADIAKLKKEKFNNERDLEVQKEKYKKYLDEQAKAKSQAQVDEYNAAKAKKDSENDGRYNMKGDGTTKSVPTDINGTPINSNGQKKNNNNNNNNKGNEATSSVDKSTVDSGKSAVTNSSLMTTTANSVSKATVDEGVAWIESASGDFLGTTTYKKEDD